MFLDVFFELFLGFFSLGSRKIAVIHPSVVLQREFGVDTDEFQGISAEYYRIGNRTVRKPVLLLAAFRIIAERSFQKRIKLYFTESSSAFLVSQDVLQGNDVLGQGVDVLLSFIDPGDLFGNAVEYFAGRLMRLNDVGIDSLRKIAEIGIQRTVEFGEIAVDVFLYFKNRPGQFVVQVVGLLGVVQYNDQDDNDGYGKQSCHDDQQQTVVHYSSSLLM